jgi:hypothetical protein
MLFTLEGGNLAALGDQVFPEMFQRGVRINFIFRVGGLFPVVQLGNRSHVIGNIQIPVFIPIEDASVTTVYLRALRNKNMKYVFLVNLCFINRQITGRIDFLRIVDGRDKVFFNLRHAVWINTGYFTGITYPKQQVSAATVEERADGFIYIPVKGAPTFLEFNGNAFTLFY